MDSSLEPLKQEKGRSAEEKWACCPQAAEVKGFGPRVGFLGPDRVPRTESLKQQPCFVLRLWKLMPEIKVWPSCLPPRAGREGWGPGPSARSLTAHALLACRGCPLYVSMSSPLYSCLLQEPMSPVYKDTIMLDRATSVVWQHLNRSNYICSDPISKQGHILGFRGSDQNMSFGGRGHNSAHNNRHGTANALS